MKKIISGLVVLLGAFCVYWFFLKEKTEVIAEPKAVALVTGKAFCLLQQRHK
jgi:hypothetical protein